MLNAVFTFFYFTSYFNRKGSLVSRLHVFYFKTNLSGDLGGNGGSPSRKAFSTGLALFYLPMRRLVVFNAKLTPSHIGGLGIDRKKLEELIL